MELDPKKRFPVYRNESVEKRVERLLNAPNDSWMTEDDIAAFYNVSVEEIRRILAEHKDEIRPSGTIIISEDDETSV